MMVWQFYILHKPFKLIRWFMSHFKFYSALKAPRLSRSQLRPVRNRLLLNNLLHLLRYHPRRLWTNLSQPKPNISHPRLPNLNQNSMKSLAAVLWQNCQPLPCPVFQLPTIVLGIIVPQSLNLSQRVLHRHKVQPRPHKKLVTVAWWGF